MGTKIGDLTDETKKIITVNNLVSKTISIDAFNVLYQFLSNIRSADGNPLKDFRGRVTSHLQGFLSRTINLLERGIKPIYVFDGKPNELKKEELERRKISREESEKKMTDAIDNNASGNEIKKFSQGTSKVNSEMIQESKQLLTYLGVPVVEALEDGEAQASYMVQKGDVWACASQDYDAFLFGADRIIRNLTFNGIRKVGGRVINVDIEYYNLQSVLEHNNLTREQLVDIAILSGVDFYKGVRGIGAKKGYDLIQKHGDLLTLLENDIECIYKFDIDLTEEKVKTIRKIFLEPKITDDYSISFTKPEPMKIKDLLVINHDFNPERVQSYMKRLIKKANTQTRMDSFFKK